jgi:hypothetical protein
VAPVSPVTTATESAGVRATRARTIPEATPGTPGTLAEVMAAQAETAAPVVRAVPVEDQVGAGVPEMEVVAPVLPVEDLLGAGVPGMEVVELVPEVAAAAQEVEVVPQSPADKAAIRSAATRVTGCSRAVGVNSGQVYGFDRPGLRRACWGSGAPHGGDARAFTRPPRVFAALILPLVVPLGSSAPAAGETVVGPHRPKPSALDARVAYWKRICAEFGAGEFVLHDRENLGVIHDVVQVGAGAKSVHELATLFSFSSEFPGTRRRQLAPVSRLSVASPDGRSAWLRVLQLLPDSPNPRRPVPHPVHFKLCSILAPVEKLTHCAGFMKNAFPVDRLLHVVHFHDQFSLTRRRCAAGLSPEIFSLDPSPQPT